MEGRWGTRGDVEGVAMVVGKVSKRWSAGQWKPVMALPGSSLLPRLERRELERRKPKQGEEDRSLSCRP